MAVVLPAVLAFCALGVVMLWFGAVPRWPQVMIPLSVGFYVFFGLIWVRRRRGFRRLGRLLLVVPGAHLAVWLPFLLAAYLTGDGPYGLAGAVPGALVTGLAVGWYVLSDHLWQTGAITLGLMLLVLPNRCGLFSGGKAQ